MDYQALKNWKNVGIGETEMKKKRKQKTQQHIVPSPHWLQKRMLSNLTRAAKNKVSPSRAKTAKAILLPINEADKSVHANKPPLAKPTVTGAGNQEAVSVKRSSSRIRKMLKATVTKYAGGVKKFAGNFCCRGRNKKTAVFSPNPVGRRTNRQLAS